jgi:single-strand DNA-binding protein
MAKGVNKAIIVGTVGKDPELKYFQSGDAYTTLSVATSEQWKDKQGEKQEKTEWHRVKFTRKLAEIVGEYVKKGQLIYVEGRLETQKYTDKQGIERYSTDIVAHEMQMLGGKKQDAAQAEPKPAAQDSDPFGDDVPF